MSRPPLATITLAAVLIGLWVATEAAGGSTSRSVLDDFGARRALHGFPEEPWRLFCSMFLHYGFSHLVGNLLAGLSLGVVLERLLGPGQTLALFLLAGYGGNLVSSVFTPTYASVGASGAVFGLIGALLALLLRGEGKLRPRFHRAAVAVLAAALLLGLAPRMGGLVMDTWAHAGGAFLGLLFGLTAPLSRLNWVPLGAIAAALAVATWMRGPSLF